jgi:hypothetical protein
MNMRHNPFMQIFRVVGRSRWNAMPPTYNLTLSFYGGQLNPETWTRVKGSTLLGFQFLFLIFNPKWEPVVRFSVGASLKVIPWEDPTGMPRWCPGVFVIPVQHRLVAPWRWGCHGRLQEIIVTWGCLTKHPIGTRFHRGRWREDLMGNGIGWGQNKTCPY